MTIGKQEFLDRAQLDHASLEVWIEEQWLLPADAAGGLVFSDADLARALLIRDLKQDFGVNDEGVGIILDLIDQIHGLRRTLAELMQSIHDQSLPPGSDSSSSTDLGKGSDT